MNSQVVEPVEGVITKLFTDLTDLWSTDVFMRSGHSANYVDDVVCVSTEYTFPDKRELTSGSEKTTRLIPFRQRERVYVCV